jgi:hypothetical protein
MTIAACYLSSEGVVLGADSTSTIFVAGPNPWTPGIRHLNYAQKVFEIGRDSTLGITLWGMGAIGDLSHRALIAHLADDLTNNSVSSVEQVAGRFSARFWTEYSTRLSNYLNRFRVLHAMPNRGREEESEIQALHQNLSGGFCIGGYVLADRRPEAFEITYYPGVPSAPVPQRVNLGVGCFWGLPNIIDRVILGIDRWLWSAILASGRWSGTDQELLELVRPCCLSQPFDLPLREAIDWVHSIVYTTIKAMKFSHLQPVCGGPIEIAVISTDRPFRWVKHKRFDEALG